MLTLYQRAYTKDSNFCHLCGEELGSFGTGVRDFSPFLSNFRILNHITIYSQNNIFFKKYSMKCVYN